MSAVAPFSLLEAASQTATARSESLRKKFVAYKLHGVALNAAIRESDLMVERLARNLIDED